MRRRLYIVLIVLLAGIAAFAILGIPFLKPAREHPAVAPLRPVANAVRASPSLHCLFSDFTHASVVVGFDFVVAFPSGSSPRFSERAEAVRDNPAVDFDSDHRPTWSYALDDGTPTITSPGGETRILLYGFKPGLRDASWIEAGIRSNDFRNLDGKCLQAHFP